MKGQMRILNGGGDEKIEWDTEAQTTVDVAASRFAKVLLNGGLGFVTAQGKTSLAKEFDPFAERIVVTPKLVGG